MVRLPSLALIALASYAIATSTRDSVQLFIDNMDPNAQWAASIQNACDGTTTYVVSMSSAPGGGGGQKATITEAANLYQVTTPAVYSETSATMHESCALNTAESSASCVVTVVAQNFNTAAAAISQTITYNLTGTGYYQYDVQITAGASHTAKGGACLAKANHANTNSPVGSKGVVLAAFAVLTGIGTMFWM